MIPPRIAPRRLDGPYALMLGLRWAFGNGMDLAACLGRTVTDADQVDLLGAWLAGDGRGGPVVPVCAWDGERNVAAEFTA